MSEEGVDDATKENRSNSAKQEYADKVTGYKVLKIQETFRFSRHSIEAAALTHDAQP